VVAYNVTHRGALLASEVAVGLALLAFIPFLAALVPLIWRAGQQSLAVAVGISGSPRGSPPAITRHHSGGLAGFDP
jgi:hypothetical protein